MLAEKHQKLADAVWKVADKLRGPYRPPQYRRVMLPMIVLRRLDCVLEPTKAQVLAEHEKLKALNHSDEALHKALARVTSKEPNQPLYTSQPTPLSVRSRSPNVSDALMPPCDREF